jgi:hypothetical protein
MMYDDGSAQPTNANPNPEEQVQPPIPSLNYDEGPKPIDDGSAT